MREIGERLKEERLRLNLTQSDLAEIGQASKRAVIEWEKGASFPNAKFLSMIDLEGLDVLYVVTGKRAGDVASLSDRESAFLDSFRKCDEELKATLEKLAAALSGPATPGESLRAGLALGEALASTSKYILKHGKLRG